MANTVLIVLGMAGSGKTVFCHRLYSWLSEKNLRLNKDTGLNDAVFGANLDPASIATKMPLHYDIREHVSVADLMEQKRLGPNGAILTALNLFVAQIDTFVKQIEEAAPTYTVIDTPGQIEMFTTSVSGQILTKCLSGAPNTEVKLLYVLDGESAQNPQCFVSNMLFATSIFYRFKEPLLLIVNKSDIEGSQKIRAWTSDFSLFTDDLTTTDFITPTLRSMALWTEEFYSAFKLYYVSSLTSSGKTELLAVL
ncbi:hypothetical protein NEDG_02102 [Nematocida displodere]|uniref:GPN-loop GTPase n=1 Tax=Nematocida displodere TaxID=1805483 RepID=A0A177EJM2_9MICR|nr:hypothetical protein NEDG_02102 [Nematocida displodere]